MVSLRQEILHAARDRVYDPNERRARYLRERQLKGRDPAAVVTPGKGDGKGDGKGAPGLPGSSQQPKDKPPSTPVTPARVAALKVRLETLRKVLEGLVEQAKKDAGVETPTKETPTKKSAEDKQPAEKKTAAEKKDDAKAAKESRDKAPPKPETASSVQAQIESVRNQIEDMRAKLAAARKAAPKKKSPPESKSKTPEADQKKPTVPTTATEGRHK